MRHNRFINILCSLLLVLSTALPSRISAKSYDTTGVIQLITDVRGLNYWNTAQESDLEQIAQRLSHIKHLSDSLHFRFGLAWYYLLQGNVYLYNGDYEASLNHYRQALYYNEFVNDPLIAAMTSVNMAITNINMGNNQQAVDLCLKALDHASGISDAPERDKTITNIYLNMARPLAHIGDYEKALFYLEKGRELAEKNNFQVQLTAILISAANCYQALGDTIKALEYYHDGLKYSRQYKLIKLEQSALMNIGHLNIQMQQHDKAVRYLLQALEIDTGEDPYYTVATHMALGSGYFQMHQPQQAHYHLKFALDRAIDMDVKHYLPGILEQLAVLHEQNGQVDSAYRYLKSYVAARDSILGPEQAKSIQELEGKYQLALKDKQLAEIEIKLSRRKNTIIVLISLATMLIVTAIGMIRHRSKMHQRKIRILQQQHELDAFKSMIQGEEKEQQRIARELHDGVGGMVTALNMKLHSIQKNYTQLNAPAYEELDKALSLVRTIAGEIRQTSRNLMPETLLDHGLANALRQYCAHLERSCKTRFDLLFFGNLEVMSPSESLAFYRIIQEIIQNIVKHANATEAVIQLREHDKVITLHVEDNGVGFDTTDSNIMGHGLSNVKARVGSMKGFCSIASNKEDGTTIHIEVDLKKM